MFSPANQRTLSPSVVNRWNQQEHVASCRLPADYRPAELGEVLLSESPGRANPQQPTFFKSVRNAAQDIVCAREILAIAEREGLGQIVDI
jgi:ornithine cyclodeaminase/alanine dehydrogenase-like protein (mu-crystallin family)